MDRYRNRDVLEYLYIDEGLSGPEIATIYDVSARTIYNWLEKYDIKREYRKGVTHYTHPDGYEMWKTSVRNKVRRMSVHRLLAIAKYGPEKVKDMDVHHKNGIPWDNRPENIEILTHGEHAAITNKTRSGNWREATRSRL